MVNALGSGAVRQDEHDDSILVLPRTSEEVAEVLRTCSRERWATGFTGGETPEARPRARVVISAAGFRGVLEYEPADLTIAVASGTVLSDLRTELRRNRQRWPVDAPSSDDAPLGGAIASGRAGPARFGDGRPRDHVLGVEVVTGDGRILTFGGRVVKIVAGYDITRLLTGSRGTLGFITRAHLRLRAVPESDVTAVWFAAHPIALLERAQAVQTAWPAALELLSPPVSHAVTGEVRWALLVRVHGNTDFVSEASRRLSAQSPDRLTEPTAERDGAWLALDRSERDRAFALQVAGLPANLDSLLDIAHEITDPDAGRWRIAAHAGNGIVRIWRQDRIDEDRAVRLARAIASGRRALIEQKGVIDVTDGEEMMPASFEPRTVGEVERRLIAGVRRVFDPAGILSRQPSLTVA
jgi:glycolate oxidase FAD binding subunit